MQIAPCSRTTAIYFGATLLSFFIILLLSNTRLPEANADVPNTNLLHSVIKILNRYINTTNNATMIHRRSHGTTMSSHPVDVTSSSSLSASPRRSLLWLTITSEQSNSSLADDQPIRSLSSQNTLPHTIRHHGKHHKINSSNHWHRHKFPDSKSTSTSSTTPPPTLLNFSTINSNNIIVNTVSDGYNNSFSDRSSDVKQTAICYNTNEVLIIIGLTCFLNFTFIMLVMTCVHFCSAAGNGSKVADYPRLESLVLGDSELSSKRTSSSGGIENIPNLHEHTDSVPLLFRPSSDSMVSLQSLSTSFCPLLRTRPSFSPLVQESTCYLDCKIPPSLSMENLLFTN
ncbi:hypothetical protein LSTR_LSTR005376 [Laodelphax striatellus]|uniref:Uncharacterized protein n=1 Tax=Laodelphax striatellus TaxID=195883 RepID=A0A482WR22_LAOST|nr:hypothetical protein LSTR_LSTR005376 [Laodelphax striatellus]